MFFGGIFVAFVGEEGEVGCQSFAQIAGFDHFVDEAEFGGAEGVGEALLVLFDEGGSRGGWVGSCSSPSARRPPRTWCAD